MCFEFIKKTINLLNYKIFKIIKIKPFKNLKQNVKKILDT